MKRTERADDFADRHRHLSEMSDEALHDYFWQLVDRIVEPLVEEARSHTTPAIERSVLLRMGFSSMDANDLTEAMAKRNLLGHGAGRLVLELAKAKGVSVAEAGATLLAGRWWGELPL